jgi:signal transduction histidine kinase
MYIIGMKNHKKSSPDNTIKQSSNGVINSPQNIEREIQVYQKKLRRLASELSLAEARERREIASDLHDHIGQALAFVSQKVSILQGNSIFSGMEEDFSEILRILEQTIRYTRNLTVEISPPVLYELGLPAAIDWFAERASKRYQLKIDSSQSGEASEISEAIKVFMFKALQELIHNTSKHAKAKQVNIYTVWRKSDFEIKVSDDGCGFDISKFESGLTEDCCFGLFSIRERLTYIGGTFEINSAPGNGTIVKMTAPYKLEDEDISD